MRLGKFDSDQTQHFFESRYQYSLVQQNNAYHIHNRDAVLTAVAVVTLLTRVILRWERISLKFYRN